MEFREILRTRRSLLGLTLEDIAKATDVTRATVQRWESGNIKNVRYDKLANLAKILEVSPAYLMGEADNMYFEENLDGLELELKEYLDCLKKRPEMRMLFSVSCDATKDDIMRIVTIISALKAFSEN